MFHAIVLEMKKQLGQLDRWLEAAKAEASSRGFDASLYLPVRLFPDQFPLGKQVQSACDVAKLATARLTGKQPPVHPDDETTIDDLQARVRSVIAWLDGASEADFQGAAARVVSLPRWEGKVMPGTDYFVQHGIPNFYFHLSHAYAILRHVGVPLGKRDFLGALDLRDP